MRDEGSIRSRRMPRLREMAGPGYAVAKKDG